MDRIFRIRSPQNPLQKILSILSIHVKNPPMLDPDLKADYIMANPPFNLKGIPFETKMTEMSQTLYAQMEESAKLDEVIRKNLEDLGYGQ